MTRRAGLEGGIFGMGVTIGDYNRYGYPDLNSYEAANNIKHYNGDILFPYMSWIGANKVWLPSRFSTSQVCCVNKALHETLP